MFGGFFFGEAFFGEIGGTLLAAQGVCVVTLASPAITLTITG